MFPLHHLLSFSLLVRSFSSELLISLKSNAGLTPEPFALALILVSPIVL